MSGQGGKEGRSRGKRDQKYLEKRKGEIFEKGVLGPAEKEIRRLNLETCSRSGLGKNEWTRWKSLGAEKVKAEEREGKCTSSVK